MRFLLSYQNNFHSSINKMTMKNRFRLLSFCAVLALAGCGGLDVHEQVGTTADGTSVADSLGEYKLALAQRVSQVNSTHVFIGRPQALLRSVVVVRYVVDANGSLVRSEIMRSNRDRVTESTALTTLRKTSPFPKPPAALLRNGRVELVETWLFNNDGRFQLRTVAEPQMGE